MMGNNACYSCGKLGHMVKDFPNRRSQEQEKERVQPNGQSEHAPRSQQFFALNLVVQGKAPPVKSRVRSINYSFMYLTV